VKIKKFNENYDIDSSFDEQRDFIINELKKFMNDYDIFTHMVSSSNWRTTGTHFTQLRQMIEDIERFKESNDVEKKWLQNF